MRPRSALLRSLSHVLPAAALGVMAFATIGCGGDPGPTETMAAPITRDTETGGCPSTFAATNGERCSKEHAICTLPVACSTFDQQATCTCTNGRFVCADALGKVAIGADPRCLAMDAASDETCAPSLEQESGKTCSTLGHACAYLGAICPERPVQNTDVCTCLADRKNGDLKMRCHIAECLPGTSQSP